MAGGIISRWLEGGGVGVVVFVEVCCVVSGWVTMAMASSIFFYFVIILCLGVFPLGGNYHK